MQPGHPRYLSTLALVMLSLTPLVASAIPVQIEEHNLSLSLPAGFEEMAPLTNDPDVVRLFVRRASPADEPNTWLSIRRLPAATGTPGAWVPSNTGVQLLGRYAERSRSLDVDALQTQWLTNETLVLESRARLSAGSVPLQLDIKSRAMEDRELKELMRTVLASAATQADERRGPSKGGWGAMFLCLLLGSALIVIVCGRR